MVKLFLKYYVCRIIAQITYAKRGHACRVYIYIYNPSFEPRTRVIVIIITINNRIAYKYIIL